MASLRAPIVLGALLLFAAPALARSQAADSSTAERRSVDDSPPPVLREFRGVWVASVANIDWPSRSGLPVAEQKAELIAILDRATALRLNAIVFQVRPAADALYASKREPWSAFLTGTMGKAPDPFYDPLTFAIDEAHRRGLELHAWFNPYRARHPADTARAAKSHVSRSRPELVRRYGQYLWLDPGDPAVRAHTIRVITDVVRRYDIDGVHIDDYFYPYRTADRRGRELPFPDNSTWRRYRRNGGKLSRDDWRRRNVNVLVEELHAAIKAVKPRVKFGISPFGIWRPRYPESVRGLDAYQEIYADSRKWLNNGWLDYLAPQLYWASGSPAQSYAQLLEWWVSQNTHERHIWPGNFTSRVGGSGSVSWPASEIAEQIRLTRSQPGATGNVHFSMRALMENRDSIVDRLLASSYDAPALVPASPWLDRTPPAPAMIAVQTDSATGRTTVSLRPSGKEKPWLWVVQARFGDRWATSIVPGADSSYALASSDASEHPEVIVVRAVDRSGNESKPVTVRRDGSETRE